MTRDVGFGMMSIKRLCCLLRTHSAAHKKKTPHEWQSPRSSSSSSKTKKREKERKKERKEKEGHGGSACSVLLRPTWNVLGIGEIVVQNAKGLDITGPNLPHLLVLEGLGSLQTRFDGDLDDEEK
jgi:hypothetical protein